MNFFPFKVFSSTSMLVLALGSGMWLYRAHASNSPLPEPVSPSGSKPVHITTLTESELRPTERFSGFVRGGRQIQINAKTNGTIVALHKEPGDFVRSGEILAVLEAGEISATKKSAVSSLNSIHELLRESQDLFNQRINEAQANLEKTEESERAGEATRQDVLIAEETLRSAKKLRDTERARAQTETTNAQGNLLVAEASVQNLTLTAPFSGFITSKTASASIGSFVSPGTFLYTLASATEREVVVSVPARIALHLTRNTPVNVFLEGQVSPVPGSVFSVAPAVSESTGETLVRLRLDQSDQEVPALLGQYAQGEFPAGPSRTALLIPESSIVRTYNETFVFTIQDEIAQKRSITLGMVLDNQREVLSGLQPGEQLVTEGMYALSENMNVHIYASR